MKEINGYTETLTEEQDRANKEKYGPNELREGRKERIVRIVLEK